FRSRAGPPAEDHRTGSSGSFPASGGAYRDNIRHAGRSSADHAAIWGQRQRPAPDVLLGENAVETISIRDIRGADLLERARRGQTVAITNRGALIGVAIPVAAAWLDHLIDYNLSRVQ